MPQNDQHRAGPALHRLAPFRQLDRLVTAWAVRSLARERALVDNPGIERRRFVQSVSFALVVLAAFYGWLFTDDGFLQGVGSVVVAGFIGANALAGFARARAYRSGWLDGRRAMVGSMAEAQRRGLSMQEWAVGEAERDVATWLGVSPADMRRMVAEAEREAGGE